MKVGFFGKLPGYGDFIQRNVSQEFIHFWDKWLIQSIESSRGQLAEEWQYHFFHTPIWCFSLDKGIASNHVITGLLMASVDKSGRCYPFTVVCESETELNLLSLSRNIDALHKHTEEFLLSLLEKDNPNLDELQDVLAKMYHSLSDANYQNITSIQGQSYSELGSLVGNELDDFSRCNDTFIQGLLDMQNVKLTLWWMRGGIDIKPQKRYFSGMPPVDCFSSFLLGVNE
ncbi:type VI secretion system-associated protein TagF [Colwellia sp. MEBiC06753]